MKKDFAGKGRKRPQIDIPLSMLELDSKNPRLAEEHHGGTQLDILKVLYDEYDLGEIAYSMVENGYFDEEPIVVVPCNLPKNFKWDEDINKLQSSFDEIVATSKDVKFIVIEGNRRIGTAKLLTDAILRQKLKVKESDFPKIKNKAVEDDLKIIPSIIYKDRKDISPYLGVRHITGILKWEAYAKARYISVRIEEEENKGKNIEESIREVQKKVGDRTDVIKKQYMLYKIFEQAKDNLDLDTNAIIDRFSLITVAINSPSIRDFIGVPSYKDVAFNKPLVPKNRLKNLEILLTWIFGNGKDKTPILTDSRNITRRLAPILADEEATEYLLKYGNLEEAYERSGGDKEFVKKKINSAKRAVTSALQAAYNYKEDKEIIGLIDELTKAVDALKKAVLKT